MAQEQDLDHDHEPTHINHFDPDHDQTQNLETRTDLIQNHPTGTDQDQDQKTEDSADHQKTTGITNIPERHRKILNMDETKWTTEQKTHDIQIGINHHSKTK